MLSKTIAASCLAVIASFACANAATLAGQTVSIDLSVVAPADIATETGSLTLVVGADGSAGGDFNADASYSFQGDLFTLGQGHQFPSDFSFFPGSLPELGCGCGFPTPYPGAVTFTLSGLTFLTPLTDFKIIHPFSDVHVTSLTDTSVAFSFTNDPEAQSRAYFTAQFITASDLTATPIPASLPLFAGGLGGLGLLGWRRKRKAVAVAA